MKSKLLISLFLLSLIQQSVFSSVTKLEYFIRNDSVFWGLKNNEKYLPKIDAETFIDLGNGYAKDNRIVLAYGKRIKANSQTFRVFGGHYAVDAQNVYYSGRKIKRAHPESLEFVCSHNMDYVKDQNNVYYGSTIVSNMPSSFEILPYNYSKDSFNIYFYNKVSHNILNGAKPNDFKQERYFVFSDKKIYLFGEEQKYDFDSFEILTENSSSISDSMEKYPRMSYVFTKDKNGYYVNGFKILENLNLTIREILDIAPFQYATPYSTNPITTKTSKKINHIINNK